MFLQNCKFFLLLLFEYLYAYLRFFWPLVKIIQIQFEGVDLNIFHEIVHAKYFAILAWPDGNNFVAGEEILYV